MSHTSNVIATLRVHGQHFWREAPEVVAYLRAPHRHEFVIRIEVRVHHDDRDTEFHMLQYQARQHLHALYATPPQVVGIDFRGSACEHIGAKLGESLRADKVDVETISVWEDDENGAVVRFPALPTHTQESDQ